METNGKTGRILVVDDNQDILLALKLLLKPHVEAVVTESDAERIEEQVREGDFDVVVLDMNFRHDAISGQEGLFWLERVLAIDADAVVLFITAYGNTEKAVRAIKAGATDFILKPWQNDKLLATVLAGVKLRQSRREATAEKSRAVTLSDTAGAGFRDFIGESDSMRQVRATIAKVARTDANVLILGENGVGKEVVARALHRNSARSSEVFVGVDLGAIPETLFESELFGYEKGAFTDAKQAKEGRFEVAARGTLFLDEIGNLTLPLQAKLLTAIERMQVMRLGSTAPRDINVRLICATNSDIYEMIDDRRFRQDLLYRINTVEIRVPPLRERADDIPLLAEHYFDIYNRKYRKNLLKISAAALRELQRHPWPGNIRELQHAIERAVIMAEKPTLGVQDFALATPRRGKGGDPESYNLEEIERKVIERALSESQGNISAAAKKMGLTRTSLYRRIEKHGL